MIGFKKIILIISLFPTGNFWAQNIDLNILKGINPQNPDSRIWRATSGSVDWIAGAISLGSLGYGYISRDKKMQRNGYELLLVAGINTGVSELLKITVNRTRPGIQYPNVVFPSSPSNDKSFPSGHTSMAFAVATTLTLQYKKWYVAVPAYLWAGSVGYSRMYLGKHYPSDVLAGAIVGAGSSWLSHILITKLFKQKKTS